MGDVSTVTQDPEPAKPRFQPRSYQQELLEDSLRQNIIIALDTGSGKTHIAVLRMKHETEKDSNKICWFVAPTVALIEQQHKVIADHIPVSVGKISGASEPDQWKDAKVWRKLINTHRILVTTPQILLDALLHGYVSLGEVGLLVFDEAHHAVSKHPYNVIMKDHYMPLPPRSLDDHLPNARVRPMVLGLTASPVYGGNIGKAFDALENNLDSVIRSSRKNRDELEKYVNRPVFKHAIYGSPPYDYEEIPYSGPSLNVIALHRVKSTLKLDEDPYVISLRDQLRGLKPDEVRYKRLDQKLSKTISNKDTFTYRGLTDFFRAAWEICYELGAWAADWYIYEVIEQAKRTIASSQYNSIMASWKEDEKQYILGILKKVRVAPPSSVVEQIRANITPRVAKLVDCLIREEELVRVDEPFSGIIFVTRRDSVLALSEVLRRLPETSELFQVGSLLGSSNSSKRHSFLDITRVMLKETTVGTLQDFRIGEKNLIISTAVAEEGIDIQACGCVIRFDLPPNMVSWAQSRGRARRKKSTLIMMTDDTESGLQKIKSWEQVEIEMMKRYIDDQRARLVEEEEEELGGCEPYRVKSTGAVLTLRSAISHLYHFCAVLSTGRNEGHVPIFDLDPPEFPEGWHADPNRGPPPTHEGPWRVTCILPRVLPSELRRFTTEFHKTKKAARYHAAFEAYVKLHKAGQLDDHLLPHFSVVKNDTDGQVDVLLKDVVTHASMASVPIQMDPWSPLGNVEAPWWCNEVTVGDFPPVYLFTRRVLPVFSPQELPILHLPEHFPLGVRLVPRPSFHVGSKVISDAQQYTLRMFASLYGTRMDSEKLDFAYLFLPVAEGEEETLWDERRSWMAGRFARSEHIRPESKRSVNAARLMKEFGSTLDWAIVRANEKFSKVLRFIGWHDGPITKWQEEELRSRYEDYDGPITYPLIIAQSFPRRTNLLVPLESPTAGVSREEPEFLLPEYATVDLISQRDVINARLLPSFLRWLTKAITVGGLRDNQDLFGNSPLQAIPLDLLTLAVTAPVSQEPHYQRLETLGDTVLKYMVSVQLFAQYETWHEGYLARRKDHAVNNSQLALDALRKGLPTYIIRDRFLGKKWVPRYFSDDLSPKIEPEGDKPVIPQVEDQTKDGDPKRERRRRRKRNAAILSKKLLADVVEALIGAAYEHGGVDLAVKCAGTFGLGVPNWNSIPKHVATALSRVEKDGRFPQGLTHVERMIGYQFKHKTLLVEALTHSSYQGDLDNVSYERLEFIGDAVLDMIVTDFLYHAPGKEYKPGDMHLLREALVNIHFLAYICMRTFVTLESEMPTWDPVEGLSAEKEENKIYLWKCLLHSSARVLDDLTITSVRFEKNQRQIAMGLQRGKYYPWAALTGLQASKFISDMVESVLGAVFLDSNGNIETVKEVVTKLGIYPIMERIVEADVDVLHPISRLGIWTAQQDPPKKLRIGMEKKDGNISCTIFVDEEEVAKAVEKYRGASTRNDVRFAAADVAIQKLGVIEKETLEEVDSVVEDWNTAWDDGPLKYEW